MAVLSDYLDPPNNVGIELVQFFGRNPIFLMLPRAHLLVVDDEASILTTLQKALTLEGYAVDVAGGFKVAEDKLKKKTYDLCLFDVMLPDGDGVELLQRIRAAGLDTIAADDERLVTLAVPEWAASAHCRNTV